MRIFAAQRRLEGSLGLDAESATGIALSLTRRLCSEEWNEAVIASTAFAAPSFLFLAADLSGDPCSGC